MDIVHQAFRPLTDNRRSESAMAVPKEPVVMLVDDEENILHSLQRLLRREGYRILVAHSGPAALDQLALLEAPASVIISDYRMPEMNGVEFLGKVRTLYPETARIILSGYADSNTIQSSFDEGQVYKFISKPWNDSEIKAALRTSVMEYEALISIRSRMQQFDLLRKEAEEAGLMLTIAPPTNGGLEAAQATDGLPLPAVSRTIEVYQEIVNNLPLALIGVDPDGIVALANPAVERIFGIDVSTALGGSIWEVLPPSLAETISRAVINRRSKVRSEIALGTRTIKVECGPLINSDGSSRGLALYAFDGNELLAYQRGTQPQRVSEKTVLIVDDDECILLSLRRLLQSGEYRVFTARNGTEALSIMEENEVGLVITDNIMPGMTGIEFLNEARERWPDTIRIMLTGHAGLDSATDAINQGAVFRFLAKPWNPEELRLLVDQCIEQYGLTQENKRLHALVEVHNALLKQWNESLREKVDERTEELRHKNTELQGLYEEQRRSATHLRQSLEDLREAMVGTVEAMAFATELRDPYTAGHQRRVSELAFAIANEMGLAEEQASTIRLAGMIHDVGKLSVPVELLTRPGRLSETEFHLIKAHPQAGYDILRRIQLPWPIAEITLQHHERLDGSGYPSGLRGGAILLAARVLAVADVVEAMAFHRPYRASLGVENALQEISGNRAVLYDPNVVDACLRLFKTQAFEFE